MVRIFGCCSDLHTLMLNLQDFFGAARNVSKANLQISAIDLYGTDSRLLRVSFSLQKHYLCRSTMVASPADDNAGKL